MGRPRWTPTAEQRKQVKTLAGYGMRRDRICEVIFGPGGGPISRRTLYKYFKKELAGGSALAEAAMSQALFENGIKRHNVSAQIFYLKTQCGWKPPPDQLEVGGLAGAPPMKIKKEDGDDEL